MSKLEEMARLGAKVGMDMGTVHWAWAWGLDMGMGMGTVRTFKFSNIHLQVQHNADNSATFRVTDTQSSIGAVQDAVPAPGTQQYRSHSGIDDSIKY